MTVLALSLVAFGTVFARAEAPPMNLAEMTARFHKQIEPCLNFDGLKGRTPVAMVLLVGLDDANRPIADEISIVKSWTYGPMKHSVFARLRTAILDCGKSGFAMPMKIAGHPNRLSVPFHVRLENPGGQITLPPVDKR